MTATPRIERFDLDPPARLVPGVYEGAYTIRTGDRIDVAVARSKDVTTRGK